MIKLGRNLPSFVETFFYETFFCLRLFFLSVFEIVKNLIFFSFTFKNVP